MLFFKARSEPIMYTGACSKIKSLNFEWVIGEELPCGRVYAMKFSRIEWSVKNE